MAAPQTSPQTKHCPRCSETKARSEFSKARDRADGLAGWCLACNRAIYAANREARKAQVREYKKRNKAKVAARQSEQYRENREHYRAYRRDWALRNRDKTRRYAREYVARRRANGPLDEDASAYWDVLSRDPCSYCGAPAGEVDHIDAVSEGGTNDWTNLTAACRSCNAGKSNKSPLDFLLHQRLSNGNSATTADTAA